VGWTVMVGAGAWCDLAGLPRRSFDELFARGPDVIVAGAFNPTGSIVADQAGYRVTGRWSFASGCEHADWLFGNCIEGIVDGVPRMRCAVFGREHVVIEDTWRVSGLAGTGSHHFHVDDVFVTGDRKGQWRCRARHWQDHWTDDAERYCWNDYRRILDAIPSRVRVTDPKTVARAWGRTNYRPPMP